MKIAEVSERTGLSKDTIRWYEKVGLISLGQKKRYANNYRKFDQEILDRLMLIKGAKSFGFTLKEIERFLLLDDENNLVCDSVSKILELKLRAIDRQIDELQKSRLKLIRARDTCSGDCKKMLE